jgi:hypothetical protein
VVVRNMIQGISRVNREIASKLAKDATSFGTRVFALPIGIRDKKSLFRAMRESVPLDPPLSSERDNWDALADSPWSGLYSVREPSVLIVWPDAGEMLRASSKDFETATAMLAEVAITLDDPKVTNGPVKKVGIVLGRLWTEE